MRPRSRSSLRFRVVAALVFLRAQEKPHIERVAQYEQRNAGKQQEDILAEHAGEAMIGAKRALWQRPYFWPSSPRVFFRFQVSSGESSTISIPSRTTILQVSTWRGSSCSPGMR